MRHVRPFVAAALVAGLATACTAGAAPEAPTGPASPPVGTTSPAAPPTQASPSAEPSPAATVPPVFRGTVTRLPAALAERMDGTSWHPGCPVPLRDLRLLTLRHWGLGGEVHQGPMVVHEDVAADLVAVFRKLFRARFPIEELHLAGRFRPEHFDPYDRRNWTTAFNCRPVVTPSGVGSSWSQHAYGLAVDINPLRNPYVASDGFVRNVIARRFRDRSRHRPGMIQPGDVVVRAFAAIGWEWGGDWDGGKDYMHFSLTGH